MVVLHHFGEDVEGVGSGQMAVRRVDEGRKFNGVVVAEDAIEGRFKLDVVLRQIPVKFFSAEDFGDLIELVVVIVALEEGLSLEDHSRHHHPQRPDIQRIVIVLIPDKQLRSLEVPRTHPDIVILLRQVKLTEAPIDDLQLLQTSSTCFF